jgi:hypothetical protein
MQKVVGSSPIIRFEQSPAQAGFFRLELFNDRQGGPSRGLSQAEASAMIVAGFVEPIVKELPLEYAVEMNRLIQIQMEGSVG